MKKLILLTIIGITLFMSPVISFAVEVEGIDIIKKGIWTRELVRLENAKESVTGYKNIGKNWKLLEETTKIPATINTSFGISFIIKGYPKGKEVDIDIVVEHPGMRNSIKDNNLLNSQKATFTKNIGSIEYNTYHLEHDYELVTGEWVFKLYFKNKKLAEEKFMLYKP